jgi:hypothetical protein
MKNPLQDRVRFEAWAAHAGLELDVDPELLCYNYEVTLLAHRAWCAARRNCGTFEAWAARARLPLDRTHGHYSSYETNSASLAWHAAQERALAA